MKPDQEKNEVAGLGTVPIRIVVISFFIFVFLFCLTKIEDYDVWWHLKTGEYIVTNQEIPTKGIFSFTAENKPWVVQGWLSTLLFYLIYSVSGLNGLTIFKALLVSLTFIIVLKLMLNKKINPSLSILILIFSLLIARHRFVVRPLIFKYPLTVLFIYILDNYFKSNQEYRFKKRNVLLLLPLLMLFWVNLHGSFFVGYIIFFAFIIGEIIKKSVSKKEIGYLLFVLFLTLGVSFLNPNGYRLHQWMFKLFYRTSVLPFMNEEVLPPGIAGFEFFWFFLILTAISFALTLKNFGLTDFLLFLPFAFLALKAVRYTGLFALVSAPILGRNLNLIIKPLGENIYPRISKSVIGKIYPLFSAVILVALMVYLFFSTFSQAKTYKFGLGLREEVYPDKAVEFIRKNQIGGNMYNSAEFGGYLTWKCYPERKIFFFNDPVLFEDIIDPIYQGKPSNFAGLFEKFNINYILKSYSTLPIESYYISKRDWKFVYWDESALVYLRDTPENRPIISKYFYRYIDPLNFNFSFAQVLVRHNFASFALNELQRNIEENPENFKAYLFLGYLYESLNENKRAITSYLEAKRSKPEAGYIHYQIGLRLGKIYLERNPHLAIRELVHQRKYLKRNPELEFYLGTAYYLMGNNKLAIKKFQKSIELNPHQPVVYSNLGFLYYDLARYREAIKAHEKAIEIDSNFADSYYGLALIYEKLVEKEEAIKNWEKYLTLGKNPSWIAIAKEHLEKLTQSKK